MNKMLISLTLLSGMAFTSPINAGSTLEQCDLNGIDYAKAKQFVIDLQKAVATDNTEQLSKLATFPVKVNKTQDSKVTSTVLKNKAALIKAYPEIFSASMKKSLSTEKPENLFCNQQGAMIGSGMVWFQAGQDGTGFFALNID